MRILSINVMGIPAYYKKERLRLISQKILEIKPDMVFLQEVFLGTDRKIFEDYLSEYYSFYPEQWSTFSRTGGLLTLSKLPVENLSYLKYKIPGGPLIPFSILEYIFGKGMQTMFVQTEFGRISIAHTHAPASYLNLLLEKKNIGWQIKKSLHSFKNKLRTEKRIVVGDLNLDCHDVILKDVVESFGYFDPMENSGEITSDKNNLNSNFLIRLIRRNKREDYCLIKGFATKNLCGKVVFTEAVQIKKKLLNLSDHYGLLTELI